MTPLADVYDGLTARVSSIPRLNVYVPGSSPVFPAAFVSLPEIPEFRGDLGAGSYEAAFEVVLLGGAGWAGSVLGLLAFVDPRSADSVFAAVKADRTLGGLNVDASAIGARGLTGEEVAGYNAWGQAVTVTVFVS